MANWVTRKNSRPRSHPTNWRTASCCVAAPPPTRPIIAPSTRTIAKTRTACRFTAKTTTKSIRFTITCGASPHCRKASGRPFPIRRPRWHRTARHPRIPSPISASRNRRPSKPFPPRSCRRKSGTGSPPRRRFGTKRWRRKCIRCIRRRRRDCPSCTWKMGNRSGADCWGRKVRLPWRRRLLVQCQKAGHPYLTSGTSRWIICR